MFSVPYYNVPSEQHQNRMYNHCMSARDLKKSIAESRFMDLTGVVASAEYPDSVCLASNPKWADRNFGAVGTVADCASLCFVTRALLGLPQFKEHFGYVSMEEIFSEAESKGYSFWKFEKISKDFNLASLTLDSLKELFQGNKEIARCTSLDDVYKLAGNPVGIGESMFFLDYIIAAASSRNLVIANDTRLHSFEEIVANLKAGFPVPMRVENAIYHNNHKRTGGHYVVLYSMQYGMSYVFDSNVNTDSGIREIATWRLLESLIADEDLICAWNCNI